MKLVNRAVYRYLASVAGKRYVLERRAGDVARIQEVADVADICVDDAPLHLKHERVRLVERRVDALFRPYHLSIEPANVDAEIRPFSQHEVVGIYPRRRGVIRSIGRGSGLAGISARCLRRRPAMSNSGIPGEAAHKYQNDNRTSGQHMRTLHA